jgi:mono/diheme cytochrome c family protein
VRRLVSALRICCICTVLSLSAVRAALAIPVFANGQGVSCQVCHTTIPAMTPYGMMVMMTNFQILNEHMQNQALPFAVRTYITTYLANKQYQGSLMVSDLSLLGGGFLGKNFTWYLEQHQIESGQIGDTDQMWLSWNGLLHGVNSLQIGKFHTPFPFMPAHAWTIGNYLLATQTTGQNDFNPNDSRWGVAFSGMSNEFMYNFSYLTGSGPLEDGLDYSKEDNPRALDASVEYGGMSEPWTVGIVGIRGFAPVHDTTTGAFLNSDAFTREGLYYGYQTPEWHFQTMYYHGYDVQPSLTQSNVPLNGFFIEIERDLGWRNFFLFRYDVADSDTLNRQYVFDAAHNVLPNLSLVGQLLMAPDQRPQVGFQLVFAGPYEPGKRFLFSEPQGIHVEPVSEAATTASAPATAVSAVPAGSANTGAQIVAQSGCTGCHGASFQGGVGPALYGIEHRLSPNQIAAAIERPHPPMPNFGFSAAQVADVIAYLSSLDGGTSGGGPTITLTPAAPTSSATLTVQFSGAVPLPVSAMAIMHMGPQSTMQTTIPLKPTSDPHVLSGNVQFSMSGPWIIEVRYGTTTIDRPIEVGDGG